MEPLSRRQFLKLAGVTFAGTALSNLPGWNTGEQSSNGEMNKNGKLVDVSKNDATGEYLSKHVPRAFQADCLPGTMVWVAGGYISWGVLTSDNGETLEIIKQVNGIEAGKPEDLIKKGTVLFVPIEVGRYSNKDIISSNLSDRLEAKVVSDSQVAEERQFLPAEQMRLNRTLQDWVMPYLDKFAPEKATTGIVLISRAPDNLEAQYAENAEHVGVTRLDYFSAGDNAFSYYRDKNGKMVLINTADGRIFSRRIYLLREPSLDLRKKIMSGTFLTSPEWAAYYLNSMWEMSHEILHVTLPSEYIFPPFDNHRFVRSLSMASVLEFCKGRKKEWNRGSVSNELWLMPEFQVLKIYQDFYKDLFAELRKRNPIGTTKFEEEEVFMISESLFAKKGLGNFRERWNEWKNVFGKLPKETPQQGKKQIIDFDKLAITLDKDYEL